MTMLITGASGNVGRPLVDELIQAGHDVRAVVRSATRDLPPEAEVVEADLTCGDQASLFRGVTALFVNPRAVGAGAGSLLETARRAGVGRVVVLAAINVEEDPSRQPSRYNGDRNTEVELAVRDAGIPGVSLRPSYFATNTIGLFGRQLQRGDVVRGPYGDFAEAPLDPADLGVAAARAMTDADLEGRTVDITGPESLTQEEMVRRIGGANGRLVRFEEVPEEVARAGMLAQGFGSEFVSAYLARLREGRGRSAVTTGGLAELLGRPPGSFDAWVGRNRVAFQRTS